MPTTTPPCLGIIEGFFGRPWPHRERLAAVAFLAQAGYDFYLYAPKADARLRRHWREDWSAREWDELLALRAHCAEQGLAFGVGLSPLEIYREPPATARVALTEKLTRLNRLAPDILCLLFDDMRGDMPELAERQVALAHTAAEASNARQLILCPTYYSDDPVLERVFGARPHDYWQTLGQTLDPSIDVFWTGPQVCSSHYPTEHLVEVAARLGRKPFLWDNYPVNDSAAMSNHLHLRAFGADRAGLAPYLAGHAANPMNQPQLSRLPLASLSLAYRRGAHYDPERALYEVCQQHCPPALAAALLDDLPLLCDAGLERLTPAQRAHLDTTYRTIDHPMAAELLDWLHGHYAFDPACLTQ